MVLFISFNIFFSHVLWAWSKVFHSLFFFFFRIGPGTFSPFSHGQSAPRGLSTLLSNAAPRKETFTTKFTHLK